MTDQDAPTQQLPPDPPPQPTGRPPLRRAADDRVFTGLCGGLGRHLDVDPVLVRVGFVLLALFGGFGIAAYVVLALVVPAADGTPTAGRGGSVLGAAVLLVVLCLAVAVFGFGGGDGFFFFAPGAVVLVLLAAACVLAVRGLRADADGARNGPAQLVLAVVLVLASAALAVGAAFAVALSGGTVVALVAVGLGIALLAGGMLGGARWLVLPALAVAVPAVLVAASGLDLRGGVGDRDVRPATLAAVEPDYRMGMGRLSLDLRDVAFRGTTDVRVSAGAGRVEVLVPEDVCVSTRSTTSAGGIDVFGRTATGLDGELRDDHAARPGRPVLNLDADVTLGQLVVSHDRGWDGWGRQGFDPSVPEPQGACLTR